MKNRSLAAATAAALATLSLPFAHELVVDLFAGGGGASEGIAMSYREPDVAVNHSIQAIAAHTANHPTTVHYHSDVFEVDPIAATGGRPVGMLWASPDCRHFSKAKGGAPRSERVRALAWVVLRWAFACKPRMICLENVEEFAGWSPLDEAGQPIPEREGETYQAFCAVLTTGLAPDHPAVAEIRAYLGDDVPLAALQRGLGYNLEARELRACRYGTPTIRKRLYVIACANGQQIVWPEPTHAEPSDPRVQAGQLQPYRTAAECIDWSIPAPSLWAAGRKPLKPNTLRRCVKGIMRFVIDAETPFIVPLRGTSPAHHSTQSVDAPLTTISAGGTHHAVVVPHLTEFANASTQRVFAVDEPLRTQVSQIKGGHFALVAPSLMHLTHHGDRPGTPIDGLLPTITGANRGEQALLAPVLIEAAHSDEGPSGSKRWGSGVKDLAAPMGTVHAGGGNFAITAASLVAFGQNAAGAVPTDPLQTVLAGAARHSIVTAHLEQANGGFYEGAGHAADRPMSTVTGRGTNQRLVCAHLVKYYGSGGQWSSPAGPMHTVPTKGRMAVVETVHIAADALTPEQWRTARLAAQMMREYAPERFPVGADGTQPEIVMIGDYILADVGLRMLRPRELARAQGFREDYELAPFVTLVDKRGRTVTRRLTATEQVRLIGNSVCPQVAAAIVAANLRPLIEMYAREQAAA